MPLLTQNKRVDRVVSTTELFSKYSHFKENAKLFRSRAPVTVDQKCLLYVQQREFAATTPADSSVSVIGSDDATTCHLVVLRHTGSGATCLAHLDGSSTRTEVPLLVNAVTALSNPSKAGRLELHLVGGFDDDKKTSHNLSREILGDPPPLSERRIVLLGKAGAEKDRVVRVILEDTKLNEECEECFVYEGEQAGRRIRIVDTPGWDSTSIDKTTKKVKDEITRSVTLCPPGPHALILVLPINTDDLLSVNELKSACQHMELLSERVWNYTMVLFLCDGDVEESRVKEHFQSAEKLLEKCRGRHYVVRQRSFETELHEFLKEIDSMVDENIRDSKVKESGGLFLPQVHYEMMPHKEDPQKNTDKSQGEKSEGKDMLRQRRGSLQGTHPNMTKQDSESHRDGTEAPKSKNQDQLHYNSAFVGALIGSAVTIKKNIHGSWINFNSFDTGEVLPMAPGDPPPLPERRIVLLGKAESKKHRVVRVILGDTKLNEECEECFVYEGEQAGRRIRIVDTLGWDSTSIRKTTTKIKNEITRSVTLCAPGPHALILVLPINTDDVPSVNELESACQHMELLSERVWNYTMVLFLCDGDVEESRVKEHFQSAEKLLEKCRGRHYVMRQRFTMTRCHTRKIHRKTQIKVRVRTSQREKTCLGRDVEALNVYILI
ncbi:uncharacterized protein LOC128527190 isoform X3 [Clarias gariepinus]|uniref:uncharacterized protein LOC128527190 isoform X3 n=1 Tax=Clarias gariepinus TaxID=13013 RepID=UPI00234CB382|nr:uncharacterized protein LOC128527190 isoform X3 [Clarias gariepinus]